MRNFKHLTLVALLVAQPSFGGWFTSETKEKIERPSRNTMYFQTSAAMVAVGTNALPGIMFQLSGHPSPTVPISLTLDTGPFFPGPYVSVPILFGMDYEFHIRNSKIQPYIGVNFGAVLGYGMGFAMLFRPGMTFSIGPGIELAAALQMGSVASLFAFVPQFGVRIPI